MSREVGLRRLTFAITGSEKRGDEGAPLFTVHVDGIVRRKHRFMLDTARILEAHEHASSRRAARLLAFAM